MGHLRYVNMLRGDLCVLLNANYIGKPGTFQLNALWNAYRPTNYASCLKIKANIEVSFSEHVSNVH